MLTRLRAQESQHAAAEVAVGSGSLERQAHRDIVREWGDQANDGRRPRAAKAAPSDLRAMGIGVHRVPRKR